MDSMLLLAGCALVFCVWYHLPVGKKTIKKLADRWEKGVFAQKTQRWDKYKARFLVGAIFAVIIFIFYRLVPRVDTLGTGLLFLLLFLCMSAIYTCLGVVEEFIARGGKA